MIIAPFLLLLCITRNCVWFPLHLWISVHTYLLSVSYCCEVRVCIQLHCRCFPTFRKKIKERFIMQDVFFLLQRAIFPSLTPLGPASQSPPLWLFQLPFASCRILWLLGTHDAGKPLKHKDLPFLTVGHTRLCKDAAQVIEKWIRGSERCPYKRIRRATHSACFLFSDHVRIFQFPWNYMPSEYALFFFVLSNHAFRDFGLGQGYQKDFRGNYPLTPCDIPLLCS